MILAKTQKRRCSPIGVDVGAAGVRAVQLARVGDGCCVTASAQYECPAGDENKGRDQERRRIAACLSQTRFRGRTAVAAVSSPDLHFHALELPAAVFETGKETSARVVHSEVERLMADAGAELETRHWILPAPPAGGAGPNAIAVGVEREVVVGAVEACRQAGLDCLSVDVAATALCRLGGALRGPGRDRIFGVLDVGERQSRLVLCGDDTPVLVRPAGSGSRAWTQRIAQALDLSPKAAEVHKKEHGIATIGRTGVFEDADTVRTGLRAMLLGALRRDLNDLAGEIKRSYEYVLRCYPSWQAEDLILVGSGAMLRGLPEFLGDALGIPAKRASEYLDSGTCKLTYRPGHNDSLETFAVAVGLLLE